MANMVNDALMSPVRKLDKTRVWVEVYDEGKANMRHSTTDCREIKRTGILKEQWTN
jgi:hypothetical protein